MDNYIIIKSDNLEKLYEEVNKAIEEWYEPLGGVSARSIVHWMPYSAYSTPEYLQALVLVTI